MTLFALAALLAAVPTAQPAAPAPLEERRQALLALLQEHWDKNLEEHPELASVHGDPRYHDRLTELSPAAIARRAAEAEQLLARFRAIDPGSFSEQDALSHRLIIEELRDELDVHRLKLDEMPVTQLDGPHLDFGTLVGQLPFATVKDYDDYLARLKAYPAQLDQTVALMRQGIADSRVLPKYIVEKIAAQVEAMAKEAPEKSAFAQPLERMPAELPAPDRKRLREGILEAIKSGVKPAYVRFAAFLRRECLPKGRAEPGVWSLPDGEAIYKERIKHFTTLDLGADEIHELGLKEVARLEGEMSVLVKAAGQPDLAHYRAALKRNPPRFTTDRASVLRKFSEHIAAMQQKLPELFGRLPKSTLEVRAVEDFREQDAAGAEYEEGTPDGARPGHVMVSPSQWFGDDALGLEATAYHEGVPGHHLQMALAQEVPGLPPFRAHVDDGAYVEGWALYAENLGKEVGFYREPASDFGRLDSALFRAVRLVLDTGLHSKRWSRQKALDYLRAHASGSQHTFEVEIDRYAVWPGQALGYKLGQQKILELRRRAEQELGPRFELKGFHDVLLEAGALPLDVLAERIEAWMARQKAK